MTLKNVVSTDLHPHLHVQLFQQLLFRGSINGKQEIGNNIIHYGEATNSGINLLLLP